VVRLIPIGCFGILPSGAKRGKGTLLDLPRSSGVQYARLPVPFCLRLRQVNRADMQAHCLRRRKLHKTPLPVSRACTRTTAETIGPALNGGWSRRGILRNASPVWSGQLPSGGLPLTLLFEISRIGFAGSNRQSYDFPARIRAVHKTSIYERAVAARCTRPLVVVAHQSPGAVSGGRSQACTLGEAAIAPADCRFGGPS
jgi:hypothetical protein